jgi:hypothetical protein
MERRMKNDQFGFSPDAGKFVVRDGKIHTEFGLVYRNFATFRSLPREVDSHENYADWSDEQREEALAKHRRMCEELDRRRKAQQELKLTLVESARKKLTEEEFDAVRSYEGDE